MPWIVALYGTTKAMDCGIIWYYLCDGLWYCLILLMRWIVALPDTTYAMDCGIT